MLPLRPYTGAIPRIITISKLGHDRHVIFSWKGVVLQEDDNEIFVRAAWERSEPMYLGYTVFEPGDTFFERYYRDKWFSIWQIASQRNGRIKGWYCNICQPIEIEGDDLRFIDMELDAFVYPDGRYLILDEDELAAADLSEEKKEKARSALTEVVKCVEGRKGPFEHIGPPRQIEPFW